METSRLFSQAAPAASSLPLWTYVQWISSLLPRAFSSFTPKYLAPLPCLLLWDSLSCLAVSCRLSWVSFSLPSLVRTEIKVFSGPSLLNPVTAVRLPTQHFTLRMMLTFCSHTQVFIILDHCPQTSPHLQKPLGKYHVQQHTHEGNSGGIMEDHCHTKKKKKKNKLCALWYHFSKEILSPTESTYLCTWTVWAKLWEEVSKGWDISGVRLRE